MGRSPLRVAIIGMGGFAGSHQGVIKDLEAAGECRLVCACDPQPERFAEEQARWEFGRRGVRIFSDHLAMLDACRDELDVVTVPTPVPLHAPMHRAVVERGLACYLEKPPTLHYAELDEMLAVEARAARSTVVGFGFIVEATRQALKRRILDGEFGAVRRAGFLGLWPRLTTYFERASWAGRLMLDGRWTLDSCIGNAMAHYLHNLLFWCGRREVLSWAEVDSVEAELYRAHRIESFDTAFLHAACSNGTTLHVAATHACESPQHEREWVECERATLTFTANNHYRIDWQDGRQEETTLDWPNTLGWNFRAYFAYLRGEASRPLTRLVDTRPFVHLYDLALIAGQRIHSVPEMCVNRAPAADGQGAYAAITGIQDACERFLATGRFPSQQGAPWGQPGGQANREDLTRLDAVVVRMMREA